MLLSLPLHFRDLRRNTYYQMVMECTGNVQLDGLRDRALNAIWGVDGGDLSRKISYALVIG